MRLMWMSHACIVTYLAVLMVALFAMMLLVVLCRDLGDCLVNIEVVSFCIIGAVTASRGVLLCSNFLELQWPASLDEAGYYDTEPAFSRGRGSSSVWLRRRIVSNVVAEMYTHCSGHSVERSVPFRGPKVQSKAWQKQFKNPDILLRPRGAMSRRQSNACNNIQNR